VWITHSRELLLKERRIGSAIIELCSQKQVLIENTRSRYSNRTVTLIEHSPKYSNRTVTEHTTQLELNALIDSSQLESNQPVHSSATFKSPYRQFSYNQCTQ